jgi:hypothetical protein
MRVEHWRFGKLTLQESSQGKGQAHESNTKPTPSSLPTSLAHELVGLAGLNFDCGPCLPTTVRASGSRQTDM